MGRLLTEIRRLTETRRPLVTPEGVPFKQLYKKTADKINTDLRRAFKYGAVTAEEAQKKIETVLSRYKLVTRTPLSFVHNRYGYKNSNYGLYMNNLPLYQWVLVVKSTQDGEQITVRSFLSKMQRTDLSTTRYSRD